MPKRIDHEAREIAIGEAAWAVLHREGTRGLSVRNVAAEAGLAVSSLRRNFPTQQSLILFSLELVMHRARKRIEGLDRGLPDLEYAQAVAEEVLPLDAERRIEMEVWLALSVGSRNDRELQDMCATSDQALQRLCVRLVERLLYGAMGGGREASAELEGRRLHALLDGLALQLIRQTAESPATWACEVVRAHLRGLLTN